MTDLMIRGLARDAGILALACNTTELAAEATRRHATSPIATLMLGRGVTAGALMGGLLKNRQRLALRIGSNGPVSKLIAESDSYGRVRGYIVPATLDLAQDSPAPGALGLFGNVGLLTVSKDLVRRGLSEGAVPLEAADLDANLEF
jgi:molecular chaperone Hsp33